MKMLSILLLLCFTLTTVAHSQEYKKIKVGCGFGYTLSNNFVDFGLLIYLEPSYRLRDNLSVGLRMESAGLDMELLSANIHATSYTLNSQYYFGRRRLKPLLGLGMGMYRIEHNYSSAVYFSYGLYPRAGFDVGHFNLTLDYNLIAKSDNNKYNYLGIRIGIFFGGGKKQTP